MSQTRYASLFHGNTPPRRCAVYPKQHIGTVDYVAVLSRKVGPKPTGPSIFAAELDETSSMGWGRGRPRLIFCKCLGLYNDINSYRLEHIISHGWLQLTILLAQLK